VEAFMIEQEVSGFRYQDNPKYFDALRNEYRRAQPFILRAISDALSKLRIYTVDHVTLVQISFLKTLYFGQHNDHWAMVHPIIPLNTLSLGVLMAINQSFAPRYFGQHNEFVKKGKGNLILQMAKTCPKS
jgi:hypothetical protein